MALATIISSHDYIGERIQSDDTFLNQEYPVSGTIFLTGIRQFVQTLRNTACISTISGEQLWSLAGSESIFIKPDTWRSVSSISWTVWSDCILSLPASVMMMPGMFSIIRANCRIGRRERYALCIRQALNILLRFCQKWRDRCRVCIHHTPRSRNRAS